jgi:hypothetical protein
LHKNQNLTIGVALILADIILYGLLHDISKLAIFSYFKNHIDFSTYSDFQSKFYLFFSKIPLYKTINNHLGDLIWFASFSLIISNFLESKYSCFFAFSIGLLTEVLQLIIPALGTFDLLDVLTYFLTTILFFAIRTT